MSFKLVPTSNFLKELKKLKKKYSSLENDLEVLENQLLENPPQELRFTKTATRFDLLLKAKLKGKVAVVD